MKGFYRALLLLLLFSGENLKAQPFQPGAGKVFNDSIIPRIDVMMNPDSLAQLLTNLYSDHEYAAQFFFSDGVSTDTIQQIGFRLRGNTSQSAEKKSFKVSFNAFEQGGSFYGLEKLNLNGEHNDPCIVRSKMYWETLRSMNVPGPRANHVDLYINGDYFGLYINVEHIDEKFIESRFGNEDGNLFKCLWPADLNFISNDPDDYKLESSGKRVYELQTNQVEDDYADLAQLIDVINNTPDALFPEELEKMFNVNSFLRTYAVDVATGNWDSYSININNYYLYHNSETDKFEFIAYDTDNTYGIDWFGIDWGTRDMYNWFSTSQDPILIERIFTVPEYVDRFTFFMKQLQQGMMNATMVFPIIDDYLSMISSSAQNDIYRTLDYGWSYNDFLDSYTQALGGHVDYGLKPFITTRHNATQNQLQNPDVIPIISNVLHSPKVVHEGDSILFTAWIQDESTAVQGYLEYQINIPPAFILYMHDDGLHNDGLPDDDLWGISIEAPQLFDTVHYRIVATDPATQVGFEPRSGMNFLLVEPVPQLFINEVMAVNNASAQDEFGETDDWLEIYNSANNPTNTKHIYLTDEAGNPDKWRMDDALISANGFALIWCDEQTSQGDDHASFRLNGSSETVWMYEGTGEEFILLDSVSWLNMNENLTIGYYPDGVSPAIALTFPTPGYSNVGVGVNEIFISACEVYPNPFSQQLIIECYVDHAVLLNIELINSLGEKVLYHSVNVFSGNSKIELNKSTLSRLPAGIYFMDVSATDDSKNLHFAKKLIKIE